MQLPGAVVIALALAATVASTGPGFAAGRSDAESREARRRWALARMDEMASEALRCRQRFQKKREIEVCEAEFTRKFRQYNEMYIDASRE